MNIKSIVLPIDSGMASLNSWLAATSINSVVTVTVIADGMILILYT